MYVNVLIYFLKYLRILSDFNWVLYKVIIFTKSKRQYREIILNFGADVKSVILYIY